MIYLVTVRSDGSTREYVFKEYVLARVFIQSLAPGVTYEINVIPEAV